MALTARRLLYLACLGAAAAALVIVNTRAGADVGGQECLALLVLEAAALGAAAPRWPWLSGIVIGAAIGASMLATVAAGGTLPASMHPRTTAGAASLLVLTVPALLAALGAAALRRR